MELEAKVRHLPQQDPVMPRRIITVASVMQPPYAIAADFNAPQLGTSLVFTATHFQGDLTNAPAWPKALREAFRKEGSYFGFRVPSFDDYAVMLDKGTCLYGFAERIEQMLPVHVAPFPVVFSTIEEHWQEYDARIKEIVDAQGMMPGSNYFEERLQGFLNKFRLAMEFNNEREVRALRPHLRKLFPTAPRFDRELDEAIAEASITKDYGPAMRVLDSHY